MFLYRPYFPNKKGLPKVKTLETPLDPLAFAKWEWTH